MHPHASRSPPKPHIFQRPHHPPPPLRRPPREAPALNLAPHLPHQPRPTHAHHNHRTMWQGVSMIPKPRLSTTRRPEREPHRESSSTASRPSLTPSRNPRTPSRLPRPPVRYTDQPTRTPTADFKNDQPVRQVYRSARGDPLAEGVIATGILAHAPQREDLYAKYHHSTHRLNPTEQAPYETGATTTQFPADDPTYADDTTTPPRPQNTHSRTNDFTTPIKHTPLRSERSQTPDPDLVIDEELVTRTPAKHKNTEWLASFGIDISLLKLTDDDDNENRHPNLTPVRGTHTPPCGDYTPPSYSKPNAFERRRVTDFYGCAPSDTLPTAPTRVASARKSRRASARISMRELDALKTDVNDTDAPRVRLGGKVRGSDVFLTPVRASRKQREKNGTPVVLSEVRRSLRINTPSKELVPKDSVRGRIELLEANDHSYIPNPCLSERSVSG